MTSKSSALETFQRISYGCAEVVRKKSPLATSLVSHWPPSSRSCTAAFPEMIQTSKGSATAGTMKLPSSRSRLKICTKMSRSASTSEAAIRLPRMCASKPWAEVRSVTSRVIVSSLFLGEYAG
ncbi:hypothetical protein D9M73_225190 [compost metagenome]